MSLKAAFERGFLKRAEEFIPGVVKTGVFSETLNHITHSLYPHSADSLTDVAERIAPQIRDSSHKSFREVAEIAKHIGVHGIAPGAVGAGVGAISGYATSRKDEDKSAKARKGALIGGAIGFGSGALHDAYNLGDNTRDQLVDSYQEEKQRSQSHDQWFKNPGVDENTQRIDKNIDSLKKSFWFEYFNPERIDSKLN